MLALRDEGRRRMKVCLLDPGLRGLMGHHFDLDLRLVRAFGRRGHEVTVHGFAEPRQGLVAMAKNAGMTIHPTFRVFPYSARPGGDSGMGAYLGRAAAIADDLARVSPADLWFWPTLTPDQLLAATSRPGPARQLGGLWFAPRFPLQIGARGWAVAARRMTAGRGSVILGAYDESLCEVYRTFTPGLPVDRLPCPHDGGRNDRRPTELRRIGFFGHQRPTRGLDLIPPLVAALLDRGFEVVLQDSGRALPESHHPRLVALPYVLDFAVEIARCDLVIWPSFHEAYLHSFSGVVSECIATGVPVVQPSGCLPAGVAARFGCGMFFHEFSVEGILEAVDEAAGDFPALAARARAAATAWSAVNGTDRLVGWIEARCRAMP